ncbi:hypothetical protein J7I93_15850 [Bacillus sp. ISL-47]|uniref:hypothetical protein n=1 Tax=Bacillus sp. ISL-47 TaxID=2819130 RepID=UPI001BEBC63C|nr:hypothetical protein [Bacillus sp. ISL-47]MBT2689663.1 hypothetical protein [Bacillus sp. ISL-47]MBT2709309.1 hypothetical protein [Pseudomonas sp. ISL-84]
MPLRKTTRSAWIEQINRKSSEVKDAQDFSCMDPYIKDKRIVLLGDSSHGIDVMGQLPFAIYPQKHYDAILFCRKVSRRFILREGGSDRDTERLSFFYFMWGIPAAAVAAGFLRMKPEDRKSAMKDF